MLPRDLREAREWKTEKASALRAQVRVHEQLIRSLRNELAALNKLDGRALLMQYGWESEEELEKLFSDREQFQTVVEELWIAGGLELKKAS